MYFLKTISGFFSKPSQRTAAVVATYAALRVQIVGIPKNYCFAKLINIQLRCLTMVYKHLQCNNKI